jgi:hypothetical protein
MRRMVLAGELACGLLLLLLMALQAQAAPERPLARHCGDAGPLPLDDPDFCGCTWGQVLFQGQPVPGAAVTLTFGESDVTGTTRLDELESMPYFDVTAHNLDAQRGDILTLTVNFAGQTISRAFRAWPEADGEQRIVLVFPEQGVWSPWMTGGYTRALALAGDVVWAGGPAGVISVNVSTGISFVHTLPWADSLVRALAVGTDDHVWAAGDGGIAEFDGAVWHTHTVPLTGTPRTLAVDPATGAVWVGGGDGAEGNVAVHTGIWQTAGTFGAPVAALAVDKTSGAWAGTWGNGVYRQDGGGGWIRYRAVDGLASDNVLAAAADGGAVWFGTAPYLSGQGPRGGIACYDLGTDAWRIYTTTHGLPADALLAQAPASVYALAMGEGDTPWAGTTDGVRFLAGESWWASYTTTHGLRPGAVQALAVGNGMAVAATRAGLDRFDQTATFGALPVAQIDVVSPLTLTIGMTLTLSGSGQDGDESGTHIVAWNWSSSLDGPLCTSASCVLPHSSLTPGVHSIALRVQDDEGTWSVPVVETVAVARAWQIYLPLTLKW